MVRTLFIAFLFLADSGIAQPPPGYYDPAQGLTGEPLRTALFNIIDGHNSQSYNSLWNHFQNTDNNGGIVWDIYSDIPGGTAAYTFTFGSDQCGNYSTEGDCYNREHTVPQSWFNSQSPMQSDLFQVYPTDGYVNGQRSNYPYGEVDNPSATTSNGSKVGPNTYWGYNGTVFEPIDDYKGDLARTYFYMMTRYKNAVAGWSSAMFTNDNLAPWSNDMLLEWTQQDTVDQKEIDRNNAIYAIQGNRNPFIDNPQWIDLIWTPMVGVEQQKELSFKIYVHDGTLHVSDLNTQVVYIEVVDMAGKRVLQWTVSEGSHQFNLPVNKGIYFVRAMDQQSVQTLKFVR